MKLLRYGPPGQEKRIVTADGGIRDLSGTITDLARESLLPDSIEKLRKTTSPFCPSFQNSLALGRAWEVSENSSALV